MKKYCLPFVLIIFFPITLFGMKENQSRSELPSDKQNVKPSSPKKIQLSPGIYNSIADWARREQLKRNQNNKKRKKNLNNSILLKTTNHEGATTFEELEKDWSFNISEEEIISTIEQINTHLQSCTDIKKILGAMNDILNAIKKHGTVSFKQDTWNMINEKLQATISYIKENHAPNLLENLKVTKRILIQVKNNPSTNTFDRLLNHYKSFFPNEQSVSLSKLKEYIQNQVTISETQIRKSIKLSLQFLDWYYDQYTLLVKQKLEEINEYSAKIKGDEEINFEILNKIFTEIDLIGNHLTLINSGNLRKIIEKYFPSNKGEKNNTIEEEKLLSTEISNLKEGLLNQLLLEKTKNFRENFESLIKKIRDYHQRVGYIKNHQLSQNYSSPHPLFPERERLIQEMIADVTGIKSKIREIQKITFYYSKPRDDEKKLVSKAFEILKTQEKNLKKEMNFITGKKQEAQQYINKGFCPVCHKLANYRCRKCKRVFYCSLDHQKTHWNEHRGRCSSTEPLYFIAHVIKDNKIAFFDNNGNNLDSESLVFHLRNRRYILKINNIYGPLLAECNETINYMQYPVYFDKKTAYKVIDDTNAPDIDDKNPYIEYKLNSTQKSSIAFSHLAYTLLQEQKNKQ